jgi:hypothetical protein
MNNLKVTRLLTLGALCLLLAISLVQSCLAQGQPQQKAQTTPQAAPQSPPQEWLSVTVVRIKPELVSEYVEFQKSQTIPGLKKAGVQWRDAWVTGIFGEGFEYTYVTPIANFAQYDGPGPMVRALGEEGARDYNAKLRRFMVSSHTYAIRTRPDLSYQGKMDGPPKLAVVTSVQVAPGRGAEFENYVKNEFLPMIKRSDVPGYWVSEIVFGGNSYEFTSLTLHNNFADVDKGPPAVRVLGRDGAMKLAQKLPPGVVVKVERSIARYNPELSILPTQAPSK